MLDLDFNVLMNRILPVTLQCVIVMAMAIALFDCVLRKRLFLTFVSISAGCAYAYPLIVDLSIVSQFFYALSGAFVGSVIHLWLGRSMHRTIFGSANAGDGSNYPTSYILMDDSSSPGCAASGSDSSHCP